LTALSVKCSWQPGPYQRSARPINSRAVAVLLTLGLSLGAAPAASAQIFLAARPNPEFTIAPLIVSAAVPRDLGPVQMNLSWGLSMPKKGASPPAEDLYLLWPREIVAPTAEGPADPELAPFVEARGLSVLATGRLALRARDRTRIGTGEAGDVLDVHASYVTFMRAGLAQLGTGTYIKIPWTPKLAEARAILTLRLPVHGMIAPRPAGWMSELFWGRRYIVTSSFGDVGQIALSLFPIYFERRDHVVHLGRDFALMTLSFPDAEQLRIEHINPAAATRRGSRVRAGAETVSLLLPGGDGLASQVLRVEFYYFSGTIAWRPIIISLVLLALGNVMGTIMLGQSIGSLARRWICLNGRAERPRPSGAVIAADTLRAIEPGATTQAEVLKLCGPPQEERHRRAGRQRTLVYRGSLLTTHRRFGVGWLAAVNHREVEHHEVIVEIENDRVRDVEMRVTRARAD
jgi:hypothetical protein